jgi:hypothetical protein
LLSKPPEEIGDIVKRVRLRKATWASITATRYQTPGGVSSQAMPLSVILKTVAPTRVALGLGSM